MFDVSTEVEALETQQETELTAFFKFNDLSIREGVSAALLPKYVDMPKCHVYDKSKREWRKRRRGDPVIGRVHSVNPIDHCKGKTSFDEMLTLNGRQCETFKEVCCELGLLNDDREWHRVLEEAAATNLCPQIREMYVIILMFCMPSDPVALFTEFWSTWTDDFQHRVHSRNIVLTDDQLKTMVLLDLEMRLSSFEKCLTDFGLVPPTAAELAQVESVVNVHSAVIREELDFNVEDLSKTVDERVPTFTPEQATVFDTVLSSVRQEKPLQVFIDARGGCGKTYLLNSILAAVRNLDGGSTALAMATTGIAANFLTLGRTFHSCLKAPLTATEDSTLSISAQSQLAQLIRMSKLLLIDESTMLNRYMLEALDRTLRDIMGEADSVFGNKILLLAGDFRQCLPVVPNASRAGIVAQCINQSPLWKNFKILRLSENMRVHASNDQVLKNFDRWTLSLGNAEAEQVSIPDEMISTKIIPNTKDNMSSEGQSMERFIGEQHS